MPIDELPDGPDPAVDPPAVFSQKAAASVLAQKAMVTQMNAALSAFDAALAGGAYAMAYIFNELTADADPGPGVLRLDNAAQQAATVLRLNNTIGGKDYLSVINTFDDSTSLVKGTIRLVKQSDLSKWLMFNVTGMPGGTAGYQNISVTLITGSSFNPFANGDSVLLYFQRSGDKGTPTSTFKASDRKASGTAGGSSVAGDITQTRVIGSTDHNNISGASLSGNAIILTIPGKYRFRVRAPFCGAGFHQAFVYCVTSGTYEGLGSSASNSSAGASTDSIVNCEVTHVGTRSYTVRHFTSTAVATSGLGASSGSGQMNVYTEVEVEKLT